MALLHTTFYPSVASPAETISRPWNKKSIVEHALIYASRGWLVFPSPSSGEKKGCVSADNSNGNRWGASSDEDEIIAYYIQFPKANVGIATGPVSGIFVMEADTPNGHAADGLASLKELESKHGPLPETLMAESPSGSVHYYFQYPDDGSVIKNSASEIAPGIDVRGDGGMVIAPPSIRPGKGQYRWLNSNPVSEAPDWLKEAAKTPPLPERQPISFTVGPREASSSRLDAYGQVALTELAAELASVPFGQRSDEAWRIPFRAGRLIGGGCLTEGEAYSVLSSAALSWGISHRDKALGPKGTIARALKAGQKFPAGPHDDLSPYVEISLGQGESVDDETGEIIEVGIFKESSDYPDALLDAPGLINDIADWIMETSMFPCRLFSVAAALSAVGTAIGRQVYTGIPRTGSSLYWLIVAPTASGKDRPQEAIKQLFEGANLSHLVKSSVSSSAKLGMSLQEKPLQIQVIDEVGKVLRKFVGRNASTQEMALLDDYCTVWGKNLGSFTPEGVTTRGDIIIRRPSLTLFGATTPINFYTQLRNDQIAGGFLNRFLVLHRFNRVAENSAPRAEESVPPQFIEAIRSLHTFQDGLIQKHSVISTLPDHAPPFLVVPIEDEAERKLAEYRVKTRDMIHKSDEDPIFEIWARSAEMVKRMALILACARNYDDVRNCRIRIDDVVFAGNLVDWSMETFMDGMRQYVAANDYQANSKMVLNLIRKAGRGGISRSLLYKKVDHKLSARDIQAVTASLAEAGDIAIKNDPGTGRTKTNYIYSRNE